MDYNRGTRIGGWIAGGAVLLAIAYTIYHFFRYGVGG